MDPLSHIAVGRTLAALRRPEAARGLTAAAVLGALSPDLDAVLMPFGWDRYLRVHEAGTHSLVGTAVCALFAAGLVRLAVPETPVRRLWTWAWLGALSHVGLDLLSGAQIKLGWPLLPARSSVPLVAMADPAIVGWSLFGLLALWLARAAARRVAAGALAVLGVYLTVKAAALGAALSRYEREAAARGEPVLAHVTEARWGSLATWQVADRTRRHLRVWETRPDVPADLQFDWPVTREVEIVRESRRMSTVDNFLAAHDLAFPVVFPQADGGRLVLWSDIRYCWDPDLDGRLSEPMATTPDGRERMACGLWFGGESDAAGRTSQEIVRIGGWIQTRDPAR